MDFFWNLGKTILKEIAYDVGAGVLAWGIVSLLQVRIYCCHYLCDACLISIMIPCVGEHALFGAGLQYG
jgi:hypothetical protein